MKYCIDITEKWLGIKRKITNNVIIPNNCKFVKYKGKKYYVDNNHIKINFKNGEKTFANIISKLTDKRIELFPRFDYFKSVDVKIGKEYIDFKITTSGTDKFIYGNITSSRYQSNNYIFWIKNDEIANDIINYQIDDCFRRISYVNRIGIYHNGIFKMFKRKK